MKRIIIVTGASSGLGLEFARQLSRERDAAEIWLLARRKDKLELLAADIEAHGMGHPIPKAFAFNLAGAAGVRHFQDLLKKERESGEFVIDALVNNAGFGTYGTFQETALERELEMIDLNAYALTGLCHAAVPLMAPGSILVNVASLASYIPLGNFAVYGATKAYVLNFTVALAAELADAGILVSAVCPGPVDTEFANVASNGARERVIDGKRPEDVVAHCLRGIRKGKHVIVMAPKWKFKAFMSRFIGRYFFARYTYIHEKRPHRP
jgi:short-subunit dehydrogenase